VLIWLCSCSSDLLLSPPDKPSPPRDLVISEVTSESAYLTWKVPEDNGGAVISHYVVQKKDVAADQWVPVAPANKKLSLMAMYLMEGIQYLFRVAAENQFGRSDFVVTKTPVKAEDRLPKSLGGGWVLIMWSGRVKWTLSTR
uniref:Fibronectin type-III domain-containing protein n=1 Tax=Acanthochromis polyacanthus TaxID=80966 RepID=A0A3Q1G184_9TELE